MQGAVVCKRDYKVRTSMHVMHMWLNNYKPMRFIYIKSNYKRSNYKRSYSKKVNSS